MLRRLTARQSQLLFLSQIAHGFDASQASKVVTLIGHEGVRAIVFVDDQKSTSIELNEREAAARHKAAGELRRDLADLRAEVTTR